MAWAQGREGLLEHLDLNRVLDGHLEPATTGAEPERRGGQQLGIPIRAGHDRRVGDAGPSPGRSPPATLASPQRTSK